MQNWKTTATNSSPNSNSLPSVESETLQADSSDGNLSTMLSGICNYEIDDDFFNFSPERQERSASFGGSTQYSQQYMHRRYGLDNFESSLTTLASDSIGRIPSSSALSTEDFYLSQAPLPSSFFPSPPPQPPLPTLPPAPPTANGNNTDAFSSDTSKHRPTQVLTGDWHFKELLAGRTQHLQQKDQSLKMMHPQQNHNTLRDEMCDGTATSSTSSVGRLGADAFVGCVGVTTNPEELMMNGEEMPPIPRDRCNTWPMRRPQLDNGAQLSPLVHDPIPEEDEFDLYGSSEQIGRLGGSSNGSNAMLHSPDGNATASFSPGMSSPGLNTLTLSPSDPHGSPESGNSKKSTTRRNAWGNLSYADLITQAIIQSPDKRLTLAQVYEWMVQNVAYFRDKGDSNSSAGWKNSIRHNLSLHSRFMRIQNEGAGKSSWWVINPEAKPGRNPRRARERSNTIETSTKIQLERTRRGARKRVMKERSLISTAHAGINGSQNSVVSTREVYDEDSLQQPFDQMSFRGRTQSNLSVPGTSTRHSPAVEAFFDDLDFPTWVDNASSAAQQIPTDLVDRTDQMRIDATSHMNGNQALAKEQKTLKTEPIAPPPSYHELNTVRGPCVQNALLRNPIVPSSNFKPMPLPGQYNNPWQVPSSGAPTLPTLPNVQTCGAMAQQNVPSSSALPSDLENLSLPDQPLMDMDVTQMESIWRHELSQSRDHQLSFDL